MGEFSAWNLGFYCTNGVRITRRRSTLTSKFLTREFNRIKITDGSNDSFGGNVGTDQDEDKSNFIFLVVDGMYG